MNLIDLVRECGLEPRKASTTKGGEYHSPCPGCGGVDRFHVWPEQNNGDGSYWCRQCGRGGDSIQFLRDFKGLSFREACEKLNRPIPDSRTLALPKEKKPRDWEPEKHQAPEDAWREHAGKLVHWCYEKLFEYPEMLRILSNRGIDESTCGLYGLGFNPGKNGKDLFRSRKAWGLPEEINPKTGKPRALWLPVGMTIPYFKGEKLYRVRIRREGEDVSGPRYYVVPGSSMDTMILNADMRAFVVVESELDAFTICRAAGDIVGAIALGSAAAKPDAAAAKVLRDSIQILVALDFDRAGAKAWKWWKQTFPDCERWPVPVGKDPGEAYQAGVDLRKWILAGLPPAMTVMLRDG